MFSLKCSCIEVIICSFFPSSFLRAGALPFRFLAERNLSMIPQSALLRAAPVLSVNKQFKGSSSDEVRLKAQSEMQEYWERNMKLKRPWSPHITIYSPPLCMRNSFLHRATGIGMACGMFYKHLFRYIIWTIRFLK